MIGAPITFNDNAFGRFGYNNITSEAIVIGFNIRFTNTAASLLGGWFARKINVFTGLPWVHESGIEHLQDTISFFSQLVIVNDSHAGKWPRGTCLDEIQGSILRSISCEGEKDAMATIFIWGLTN